MKEQTRAVDFLIVDDDPGVGQVVATYLDTKKHSSAILSNGAETISWLGSNRCEVAIIDLNMPEIDGLSLIPLIRSVNPTLPIIVFTGLGYDENQMHAALCAGAIGYVSKNLPIDELYGAMSRALLAAQRTAGGLVRSAA